MNNQQKVEEYAASKTKDRGYQKELTNAVLYGIELGKKEVEQQWHYLPELPDDSRDVWVAYHYKESPENLHTDEAYWNPGWIFTEALAYQDEIVVFAWKDKEQHPEAPPLPE